MSKTKIEIIDETVAFYSEDVSRRSKQGDDCLYFGPDGKRCGYARCWKDDVKGIKEQSTPTDMEQAPDDIVKEDYKGHDRCFWRKIQLLHDKDYFWNESGLTDAGLEYANQLKSQYSNN